MSSSSICRSLLFLILSAVWIYFVRAEEICFAYQDTKLGSNFGQFRCSDYCCGEPDKKYCCNKCQSSIHPHNCPREIVGEVVGGTLTLVIIIAILFVAAMACKCRCCKKMFPGGNRLPNRRNQPIRNLVPSLQFSPQRSAPGAALLTKPPPYTGESPPSYSTSEIANQITNNISDNCAPDVTLMDSNANYFAQEMDVTDLTQSSLMYTENQNRSRHGSSRDAQLQNDTVPTGGTREVEYTMDGSDPPPPYVSTERV